MAFIILRYAKNCENEQMLTIVKQNTQSRTLSTTLDS